MRSIKIVFILVFTLADNVHGGYKECGQNPGEHCTYGCPGSPLSLACPGHGAVIRVTAARLAVWDCSGACCSLPAEAPARHLCDEAPHDDLESWRAVCDGRAACTVTAPPRLVPRDSACCSGDGGECWSAGRTYLVAAVMWTCALAEPGVHAAVACREPAGAAPSRLRLACSVDESISVRWAELRQSRCAGKCCPDDTDCAVPASDTSLMRLRAACESRSLCAPAAADTVLAPGTGTTCLAEGAGEQYRTVYYVCSPRQVNTVFPDESTTSSLAVPVDNNTLTGEVSATAEPLNTPKIIGLVVGLILFVAVAIVTVLIFWKRNQAELSKQSAVASAQRRDSLDRVEDNKFFFHHEAGRSVAPPIPSHVTHSVASPTADDILPTVAPTVTSGRVAPPAIDHHGSRTVTTLATAHVTGYRPVSKIDVATVLADDVTTTRSSTDGSGNNVEPETLEKTETTISKDKVKRAVVEFDKLNEVSNETCLSIKRNSSKAKHTPLPREQVIEYSLVMKNSMSGGNLKTIEKSPSFGSDRVSEDDVTTVHSELEVNDPIPKTLEPRSAENAHEESEVSCHHDNDQNKEEQVLTSGRMCRITFDLPTPSECQAEMGPKPEV